MVNFGKWVKNHFRKDPLDVPLEDIKREQIKIDRLASIKRDELEDVKEKIQKIIQQGVGQSKETKISLSHELNALKTKKLQLQKEHEGLMKQKKSLHMLDFMVSQKNRNQSSELAQKVFNLDAETVSELANDVAIEGMLTDDKLKTLEGALVGIYGEENLSDDTKQALEMWDELEAGTIDEEQFFEELEKDDEKMIVRRDFEKT